MSSLESMTLGLGGPLISRLGMGCWAIGGHGWGSVDDEDSLRAVSCALDRGVTFFDTADVYGLGKSETLLARALGSSREKVVIASKGGVRWDGAGKVWNDISPVYLKQAVENSLTRLKIDCIPLYYIHKPDAVTPIQESIAMLERLREEGKIGAIGVANFTEDQLADALRIARVSAIQVRLNVFDRTSEKLLNLCMQHAITLVAWGALADGMLTGKFTGKTKFSEDDHRGRMPEFKGDAFLENLKSVALLEHLAASSGHQVNQLALRWVLDYAKETCSLFGAKTDRQVIQNLGANGWKLTQGDLAKIDAIACRYSV